MHPPQKLRNAVRTALVGLTALFAVLAAAAPASAAPIPYSTSALGEDYCTFYETAGDAEWAEIGFEPTVSFSGKAATTLLRDGRVCLGVEPRARHLEFIAYEKDAPVDVHRIPVPARDTGYSYEFELSAAETRSIDYVTVAICLSEPTTGAPSKHCEGTVALYPSA